MTDPELWRRARDLFDRALTLDDAGREALLEAACGEDAELRDAVEGLLAQESGTLQAPDVASALRDVLDESRLGETLGRWRLLRRLGTGGMGTVFLAERDGEIRQQVALKVLHTHLGGAARGRFRLEKQLLAALDHPHIARLLDHGTTGDGRPFLVMEWVDGRSITDFCDRRRLGLDRRLELIRDLAGALHYAHSNRVVHRDIKPSNLLVNDEGLVKLLDFGIAKALEGSPFDDQASETEAHARPMSPGYASPEQLAGDQLTTASDLYSLAVVTFELLTGEPPFPFTGGSIEAMQALYARAEPPALASVLEDPEKAQRVAATRGLGAASLRRQLSGDLDAVLAKALHPEVGRRYGSTAEFAEDLRRCREHWPVAARTPSAAYRLRKLVRRNRLASAALGLAVAAMLALTVALALQTHRVSLERDAAIREQQRAHRVTDFLADVFRRVDPEHVGGPATSREMLFAAAERLDQELGDDPGIQATLLDIIAHALQNLGELDAAAPLLERALDLRRDLAATAGGHRLDAELAASLDALGENQRRRGDFAAAEASSRQALERRRRIFGERHAAVAESLANLAEALHELGRYDEAEPLYTRALEIRGELFGERDLLVAESLDQQALLWLNRGLEEKALGHYQRSLDIRRELLPEGHPQVALGHYHLGTVLQSLGRLGEAEEQLQRALELLRRAYGDQHPHLAHCLHDLGVLALDRGDVERAESLVRNALEVRRRLYPTNHPDLVQSLGTLGSLAARQGRLDDAETYLDEALVRGRRLFGDRHPYVAITLSHLADVHRRRGETGQAAGLIREALSILERSVGPDGEETWKARGQLATILWQSGERQKALEGMREVHEALARLLGADQPATRRIADWLEERPRS